MSQRGLSFSSLCGAQVTSEQNLGSYIYNKYSQDMVSLKQVFVRVGKLMSDDVNSFGQVLLPSFRNLPSLWPGHSTFGD